MEWTEPVLSLIRWKSFRSSISTESRKQLASSLWNFLNVFQNSRLVGVYREVDLPCEHQVLKLLSIEHGWAYTLLSTKVSCLTNCTWRSANVEDDSKAVLILSNIRQLLYYVLRRLWTVKFVGDKLAVDLTIRAFLPFWFTGSLLIWNTRGI